MPHMRQRYDEARPYAALQGRPTQLFSFAGVPLRFRPPHMQQMDAIRTEGDRMSIMHRITEYLAGVSQATGREIADQLGLTEKTCGDALQKLINRNDVIVVRSERVRAESSYRLASKGAGAPTKAMQTLEAMQTEARRRLMNGTYVEIA
jgi:DNA-binding MarR family transcriptional regulator